ncbi:MAG: hypothetical protein U0893_05705 [Chloroflexota bacterium]
MTNGYDYRVGRYVCRAGGREHEKLSDALDAVGADGWELVSVVLVERQTSGDFEGELYCAFFKAPVDEG